ncbi:other FunK1 protein kinase [Rhizoctonia solani]|uniref:Other FunK1 protein kinase n=1 Tax=Rhizoctonia solani TaxID=456999 RepID=A0A8H7H0N9_9AGAM|nr:other FunK1 protein kinase [Rhizoctonia solani]
MTSCSSSPIKLGHPPIHKASETVNWLKATRAVSEIPLHDFTTHHLPVASNQPPCELSWSDEQAPLVDHIRSIQPGHETALYTGFSPLLQLCNLASKRVFDSLHDPIDALVFYSNHNKFMVHPFSEQSLAPDIIVLRQPLHILETMTASGAYQGEQAFESPSTPTWSNVVAVGEAKVQRNARYQTANYLRNQLQLWPDLHSVLGFSAKASSYSIFYHNASAIHQSANCDWSVSSPLHAFVRQLYQGTTYDPSIINLRPNDRNPRWVVRIDSDVFIVATATPDPGLGQRRFTALATHIETQIPWFIKDFYRDDLRRFFEGVMYVKAHESRVLPGMMQADHYGYVLNKNGDLIQTTSYGRGQGNSGIKIRSKMRIATRDVGIPLEKVNSLRELLGVMYDACVVQRNLYRKSKILHRDISNNNIMIAPTDEQFYKRCIGGYDEVKYLNQVLAQNKNTPPRPVCLIVDLGNGAQIEDTRKGSMALTERTGTPKFIARSVSKGKPLPRTVYKPDGVIIPKLQGKSRELYQVSSNVEYDSYNQAVDRGYAHTPGCTTEFTHQLFHDAESTFWVISWILARALPKDYPMDPEPTDEFKTFVTEMEKHHPGKIGSDACADFSPELEDWRKILHPGLESVAHMLSEMHKYVLPEWSYRPELDGEHVHEALMRLILSEIVRIDDENSDIQFGSIVRALPVESKHPGSLSSSLQANSNLTTSTSARKRSRSKEDDNIGLNAHSGPRPRLKEPHPGRTSNNQDSIPANLLAEAQGLIWDTMAQWLKHPAGYSTITPPATA